MSLPAPALLRPRRFLWFSHGGDADALALRMQQEGAEVLIYHVQGFARQRRLYDGLVPQAQTALDAIRWLGDRSRGVILFDQVGDGRIADALRARGYTVWGGSALMDRLENDRAFGLATMRRAGIRIPETYVFKNADDAKPFLEKRPTERWVLKPLKRGATANTYPSKNNTDLLHFLNKWTHTSEAKQPFLLQKFMDGIELSTEVWVQDGKIVWPANSTIECKRYAPGDLGPNIGCASSTVWVYDADDPVVVRRGIGKMSSFLQENKYHGVLDLNSIVSLDDRYPYGLEWTSRLGYSAVYALLEVLDVEVSSLFWNAAHGTLTRFPGKPGVGYSVRVSIMPYPASELYEARMRAAIMQPSGALDITLPTDHRHIHPLDVRLDEENQVETAGYDGVICEVCGRGTTIEDARDSAHKTLEMLVQIPNYMARTHDGADRAITDTARLKTIGYETHEDKKPSGATVSPPSG